MSIYRVEKKSKLIPILLLVFGILGLISAVSIMNGPKELSSAEQKQEAVKQIKEMANGVEIFIISHYTGEIVSGGKVKLQKEYKAAMASITSLKDQFNKAKPKIKPVDDSKIKDIDTGFAEIIKAAKDKKEPSEIKIIGEKLMNDLSELADVLG